VKILPFILCSFRCHLSLRARLGYAITWREVSTLDPLQVSFYLALTYSAATAYREPSKTIHRDCRGIDTNTLRILLCSLTAFKGNYDGNRVMRSVVSSGDGKVIPFCEKCLVSLSNIVSRFIGRLGYAPERNSGHRKLSRYSPAAKMTRIDPPTSSTVSLPQRPCKSTTHKSSILKDVIVSRPICFSFQPTCPDYRA